LTDGEDETSNESELPVTLCVLIASLMGAPCVSAAFPFKSSAEINVASDARNSAQPEILGSGGGDKFLSS
jgi:hypothetical protein